MIKGVGRSRPDDNGSRVLTARAKEQSANWQGLSDNLKRMSMDQMWCGLLSMNCSMANVRTVSIRLVVRMLMWSTIAPKVGSWKTRSTPATIGSPIVGPTCCLPAHPVTRGRRELPLWPATTRGRAAGKADSFPLVDATQRAYSPNDRISREEPLLINPTMEEPARHLTFDPFGAPIPISDKGKVSIAVYNLNTRPLNGLRKRVIIEMVRLLRMKEQAKRLPPLPEKTNLLTDIRAQIRDKTAPSAPYAAAARAVANNPVSFGL